MAATLPAIHSPGGKSGPVPMRVLSPPSKAGGATNTIQFGVTTKRSVGKKERELEERKRTLRSRQPDLTKKQTTKYRNSYKHNLCLDMLQEGFHKSFAELFALIKQQNEAREKAGPESALWNQMQLENEPEKLETLKTYLSKAEDALRKDDFAEVYKCQYALARFFQSTGDKWLSDHFFESCLKTSSSVDGDGGKMAAEGHCNVGLALEESGDYFGAADNFELFHQLAKDKVDWNFDDGSLFHSTACNHLSRIYTTIANQFEAAGDLKQYLGFLQQAYDMAKEGGDRRLGGEASHRLGLAFEKNEDSKTALTYLSGYLDIMQVLEDSTGIGIACEAIAKSYESQGKIEEAIKYLEMFVEVAERSKDEKAISRACSDLGAMFNSLGRYDQAVEFFNKSYNIARAMNDTDTISSSRVLFGVAAAHKMLENVATHIDTATKPCLQRLGEWKDNRGDDFDKAIPAETSTPAPSSAQSSKKQEEKKEESTEEKTEEAGEAETTEEAKDENKTEEEATPEAETPAQE